MRNPSLSMTSRRLRSLPLRLEPIQKVIIAAISGRPGLRHPRAHLGIGRERRGEALIEPHSA